MDTVRWQKLTKLEQYYAIGAEVKRAAELESKSEASFKQALKRTLRFIDASLLEKQWREEGDILNHYQLLYLHEEVGKYYVGELRGIAALYAAM